MQNTVLKYIVFKEDKYYVSQCLNVDVASFGESMEEAIANLKEAVELYLEDEQGMSAYHEVSDVLLGESAICA